MIPTYPKNPAELANDEISIFEQMVLHVCEHLNPLPIGMLRHTCGFARYSRNFYVNI